MRPFRSASLFWTFAGSFLLVLVTATLLQGLVIVTVVEPIAARWAGERAADLAEDAAWALSELDSPGEERIAEVLRSLRGDERWILAFRFDDGRLVTDRPFPGRGRRRPGREGTPGGGPGPGFPPPREGEGPPHEAPPDVLARRTVDAGSGLRGEVMVLGRPARFPLPLPHTPRPVLFFLPVAIALSAVGGLLLFRALVRRLRALESLATRVTEGDLEARVHDTGGDEIGRLGQRLNRMTESLSDAKRRLDAQDTQRRRLLADVSHELATPLTSIRGYAETLLNPDVPVSDEERTSYLESILGESARMDLLIEDLFELTRLEAGAERLDVERLDWAALCRRTTERFQARARTADVRLEWTGTDGEAWITADGRRQEQVLENLLVNALRYVPSGGAVTVAVEGAGPGRFALEVADDGPGVPPEDLPHVFDRFYRADPSRSDGGTGLGLAIVKEIVHRHGGTVSAANREAGGAVFRVELPAGG